MQQAACACGKSKFTYSAMCTSFITFLLQTQDRLDDIEEKSKSHVEIKEYVAIFEELCREYG